MVSIYVGTTNSILVFLFKHQTLKRLHLAGVVYSNSFEVRGAKYSAPSIDIEQVRTLGTHFCFSTCMVIQRMVV